MTLEPMGGLWLPLGAGMLITQIHADSCKAFSTKSRCPCLMEFEVKGAKHSAALYKRVKRKHFLDAPSVLPQPSFWAWLCSWFCLAPQPSVDVEPFPSLPEAADSVIVVEKPRANRFRVMVKTHEAMRQEEMAAHLIDEVAACCGLHRRSAPSWRRKRCPPFCAATR